MRGRVKIFYDNKKFGFIIGEDNYEYFFHISDIVSIDMPTSNSIVDFEASSSDKGKKAINIKVIQRYEQRPEFINIGRFRIKINKIKEYHTHTESERKLVASYFLKPNEYVDVIKGYTLVISMFDGCYYTIKYTEKEDIDNACKTLDKYLGTVNL
ncbi:MAG: cold shock domain-containing protein [Clostridia bacterium]|nr:cold shock domain-containing protein [Clostridia bacterium]